MQVLEIIRSSMNLIGALAPGQSIPDYLSSSAMSIFNVMLDSFAGQKLAIYVSERKLYSLVANQGGPSNPYTLGVGGDWNQVRPMFIDRAGVVNNNNASQPLELGLQILSQQQWASIPVKNVFSTLPQSVYFENSYPLINVYFYTIPQVDYLQVALYLPRAAAQVTALTDDVAMPAGYLDCYIYNLALRLAPQMGRPIDAWLVSEARNKLMWVKSNNIDMTELTTDRLSFLNRNPYNWLTDSGG